MSINCIRCVKNRRTGGDLLCDDCRGVFAPATEPTVDLSDQVKEALRETQKVVNRWTKYMGDDDFVAFWRTLMEEGTERLRAFETGDPDEE